MSGPVWRFDKDRPGTCSVCLRSLTGLFCEGEVADNNLQSLRLVCPPCMKGWDPRSAAGEEATKSPSPAYAR